MFSLYKRGCQDNIIKSYKQKSTLVKKRFRLTFHRELIIFNPLENREPGHGKVKINLKIRAPICSTTYMQLYALYMFILCEKKTLDPVPPHYFNYYIKSNVITLFGVQKHNDATKVAGNEAFLFFIRSTCWWSAVDLESNQ